MEVHRTSGSWRLHRGTLTHHTFTVTPGNIFKRSGTQGLTIQVSFINVRVTRTYHFKTCNRSTFGHKHRHLEAVLLKVEISEGQQVLRKALYLYIKLILVKCPFMRSCTSLDSLSGALQTQLTDFSDLSTADKKVESQH